MINPVRVVAWLRFAILLSPLLTLSASDLRFDGMFTDHAVLQRGLPLRISGTATPGQAVAVSLATSTATAVTAADGTWRVALPALPAGGPYVLAAAGPERVALSDIMIGEVWVCSGQSNMAITLTDVGAQGEIAQAECPGVRIFQAWYGRQVSPAHEAGGAWVVSSAGTAAAFPAVPYFFARKLQRELQVSVGVVVAAVGATAINQWLDRGALAGDPARHEQLSTVDRLRAELGVVVDDRDFATARYDDRAWGEMPTPGAWEKSGLGLDHFDGVIWVRKTVAVPVAWKGQALELRLGAIDDRDVAYVEGVRVGGMGPETPEVWKTPRVYQVPAGTITGATATVAVRITDKLGDGGFVGAAADMSLGPVGAADAVPLAGSWRWRMVERYPEPQTPTELFNGMVAPWTRTTVRGVVWYQGEQDSGNPPAYASALHGLIRGWRSAWALGDLPFLIVQLPEFGPVAAQPGSSNLAAFREVQAAVAGSEPACHVVVTIGLGEAANIHPKNKRDVGERCGLQALARVYGKAVVATGPVFAGATVEAGRMRLHFSAVGGGLASHGATLTGFAVAGADGHYAWASASIDHDDVVISSPAVPTPVQVRYGWGNSPDCGLYNREGLPAMPFRTDAAAP